MFDPATDLRTMVILEENPISFSQNQITPTPPSNLVTITKYQSQKISLDVHTDTDRMLFLSDTYYPRWIATVDDNSTKIYRADFAFRAIVVPKGKHTVLFTFDPLSFKLGLMVSGLTICIITIYIITRVKKSQSKHHLWQQ